VQTSPPKAREVRNRSENAIFFMAPKYREILKHLSRMCYDVAMKVGDLVRFNPVYMFYDYTTEEFGHYYPLFKNPRTSSGRANGRAIGLNDVCIVLEIMDEVISDDLSIPWCRILLPGGGDGWMESRHLLRESQRGCK
jgi:hypothetical protein